MMVCAWDNIFYYLRIHTCRLIRFYLHVRGPRSFCLRHQVLYGLCCLIKHPTSTITQLFANPVNQLTSHAYISVSDSPFPRRLSSHFYSPPPHNPSKIVEKMRPVWLRSSGLCSMAPYDNHWWCTASITCMSTTRVGTEETYNSTNKSNDTRWDQAE